MHWLTRLSRRAPTPTELAEMVPQRLRWPLAVVFVLSSITYAFLTLRTRLRPWNDFAFIYAAGRTWLDGSYPYDFETWNAEWTAIRPPETEVSQPMPFMYPPYWAPLAIAIAALPWPVASRLWDILNVSCFFMLVALSLELGRERLRGAVRNPAAWIFVALAGFNPSVHYSAWQSQMAIVSTFGVVGAFWAFREQKHAWLAVFAFVAALKPQLGILALLYLFVNGGHVGLLWAAGAAIGIGFLAVLSHIDVLPAHLERIYALHMQLRFNAPKEFASLPALLASHLSGNAFMIVGVLLSVAALAAATRLRRRDPILRSDTLLQLGLIAALTGALMPVHNYDLVIYCPIAILAYEFRSSWLGIFVGVFVLFASRAHVFAKYLHVEVAPGYLTGLMAVAVLVLAGRASSNQSSGHGSLGQVDLEPRRS